MTLFFLGLCGLVWAWWVSDLVVVRAPWEKLVGPNPDPNEALDFVLHFIKRLQKLSSSQIPQVSVLFYRLKFVQVQLSVLFLGVAVVGYFVNQTLLLVTFCKLMTKPFDNF